MRSIAVRAVRHRGHLPVGARGRSEGRPSRARHRSPPQAGDLAAAAGRSLPVRDAAASCTRASTSTPSATRSNGRRRSGSSRCTATWPSRTSAPTGRTPGEDLLVSTEVSESSVWRSTRGVLGRIEARRLLRDELRVALAARAVGGYDHDRDGRLPRRRRRRAVAPGDAATAPYRSTSPHTAAARAARQPHLATERRRSRSRCSGSGRGSPRTSRTPSSCWSAPRPASTTDLPPRVTDLGFVDDVDAVLGPVPRPRRAGHRRRRCAGQAARGGGTRTPGRRHGSRPSGRSRRRSAWCPRPTTTTSSRDAAPTCSTSTPPPRRAPGLHTANAQTVVRAHRPGRRPRVVVRMTATPTKDAARAGARVTWVTVAVSVLFTVAAAGRVPPRRPHDPRDRAGRRGRAGRGLCRHRPSVRRSSAPSRRCSASSRTSTCPAPRSRCSWCCRSACGWRSPFLPGVRFRPGAPELWLLALVAMALLSVVATGDVRHDDQGAGRVGRGHRDRGAGAVPAGRGPGDDRAGVRPERGGGLRARHRARAHRPLRRAPRAPDDRRVPRGPHQRAAGPGHARTSPRDSPGRSSSPTSPACPRWPACCSRSPTSADRSAWPWSWSSAPGCC